MAKQEPTQRKSHEELLKQLAGKLTRAHGKGILTRACENPYLTVQRIPVGVFAVDYACGGGIAKGRVTRLFGEWSSGKTLIAQKIVAMAQRMCREHNTLMLPKPDGKKLLRCPECGTRSIEEVCEHCSDKKVELCRIDCGDVELVCPECKEFNPYRTIWFDVEGSYSNAWATAIGIDGAYIDISRPEYAEQLMDVYEVALREVDYDIAVVDSIAMMTPLFEIQESPEAKAGQRPGVQALLVNKFMRKAISLQNSIDIRGTGRYPTQIFINQQRVNLGAAPYTDPTTNPGGKGQEFVSSIDLRLWRGKVEFEDEELKEKKQHPAIGLCRFKTVKNRTGVPSQREGAFRIWMTEFDGHNPGWSDEFGVIARSMTKAGLACNKDGDILNVLTEATKLKADIDSIEAAIEICVCNKIVLSEIEVAQLMERDPAVWWKVRQTLFRYKIGHIKDEVVKRDD